MADGWLTNKEMAEEYRNSAKIILENIRRIEKTHHRWTSEDGQERIRKIIVLQEMYAECIYTAKELERTKPPAPRAKNYINKVNEIMSWSTEYENEKGNE